MRAVFAILIIELLTQLSGPNSWRSAALVDAGVQVELAASGDPSHQHPADQKCADQNPADQNEEEQEDDVVHDDAPVGSVALVSLAMTLRTEPPTEPLLERDIPPPQVARVVRAHTAS